MSSPAHGSELVSVVALLGAAVVAVPLFKRLGLGSVLGYLAAGLAIGPFGLGLFTDPQAMLHVAELGVVMFLFIVGLEMEPTRLWSLRREIFGLGLAQVLLCGAVLTAAGWLLGLPLVVALVAALGFVLSSTAIVMQLLDERHETSTAPGQRVVSILLLEDLAIVPLLALVAFLAPARDPAQSGSQWLAVLIALAAVAALVAAGRWALNPFFRVLASAKAREVMTAAALLVVLGAALLMQVGGLSMAMGAFLAGVLLSESSFRHQLEADVEPFRGILLGLFFMSVGMSLDLSVVAAQWAQLLALVVVFMLTKAAAVYGLARALKARHAEAATRAALLIQGGEFAFVLYSAAGASGLFEAGVHAVLNAAVIVSMALTPLVVLSLRWLVRREAPSMEGVETPHGLAGSALLIGFGRFGQIVSQSLLSRGCAISIIDTSTEAIREARHYGFKIYYGDGTRPDLLRAAGAETTRLILVCVDSAETANHIVKIVQSEFPHSRLLVRARDREHAIALVKAGVPFHVRETFESAMVMGHAALRALGVDEAEARASCDRLRSRDADRFAMELAGGMEAGKAFIHGNARPASPSGAQPDT